MKKYPKKYYSGIQNSQPHVVESTDILSLTTIPSNTLDVESVIKLLMHQVVSQYNYPEVPLVLFFAYDSLSAYVSLKDRYHAIQSLYTSVSPTIKALQSLGLLQSSYSILSWQVDYRMMVKSIMDSLLSQGLIRLQKVSYFWDLTHGISVPEYDVSFTPRAVNMHRIRYFIDSKKESVVVHTHTPHTLFADVALAVNPADRRYRKIIGKKVIVPIINRIIPIIADESIDPASHTNGVKRITPCHDYDSSVIAQRHGLPLDVYAYDQHGIFTEHATIYAGKKAVDFFDNIVQYLQDIHNYDGVEKTLVDIPMSRTTKNYLDHFLVDGWVMHTDTMLELFIAFVQSEQCHCSLAQKEIIISGISQQQTIPITASHGTSRIPLTQFASISSDAIISQLSAAEKSQNIALGLVLYDLWYDGFLPTTFSIEQLLDVLLCDIGSHKVLIESYCDIFTSWYKDNNRILKDTKNLTLLIQDIQKSDQTAIDMLVDMLDVCSLTESNGSAHTFISSLGSIGFSFLNEEFLSACAPYFLRKSGFWKGSLIHNYTYTNQEISIEKMFLEFVIGRVLYDTSINRSTITLQDIHTVSQKDVYTQCVKPLSHHSLDTMRFALLSDNLSDLNVSDLVVQKIRNVCRYVYMQVVASGGVDQYNSPNLSAFIQENAQQLTPFDQWIIYRFGEVATKLDHMDDSMFSVQYKISHIMECVIDDFAVKYVEIVKQRRGPLTDVVMLLCINQLCTYLHPIMPQLIDQIRGLFGEHIAGSYDVRLVSLPSKNYKIHLLMMIIGGLKNLKTKLLAKNHESIDVSIQASTDMNHFVQEYRPILDNIIRIGDMVFYTAEQDIPSDYIQEHVIDIVLGAKPVQQKVSDTDRLYILLKEKTEYLQHLRALASLSSNPEKELKINKLKDEIQQLEYELIKAKK